MYRLDWGFPQDPFYKLEGLGGMLQNDIAYTQLPIKTTNIKISQKKSRKAFYLQVEVRSPTPRHSKMEEYKVQCSRSDCQAKTLKKNVFNLHNL